MQKTTDITTHSVLGTDVIVIDNFISEAFQDLILTDIDPKRIPVQLLSSSSTKDEDHIPAGVLMAFDSGNITHGSYWYLLPLLMEALATVDRRLAELIRIRVGIYFSNGLGICTKNHKHIDKPYPHQVALYYADNSDGNTLIYGKEESDDVVLEIEPKKGRILLMDGSLWHCSSNPSICTFRTTINYNFQHHEN